MGAVTCADADRIEAAARAMIDVAPDASTTRDCKKLLLDAKKLKYTQCDAEVQARAVKVETDLAYHCGKTIQAATDARPDTVPSRVDLRELADDMEHAGWEAREHANAAAESERRSAVAKAAAAADPKDAALTKAAVAAAAVKAAALAKSSASKAVSAAEAFDAAKAAADQEPARPSRKLSSAVSRQSVVRETPRASKASRSRARRPDVEEDAEKALAEQAAARARLSRAESAAAAAVYRAKSVIRRDEAAALAELEKLRAKEKWLEQAAIAAAPHRHKRSAYFDENVAAAWYALARIHHRVHGDVSELYPLMRRRNVHKI